MLNLSSHLFRTVVNQALSLSLFASLATSLHGGTSVTPNAAPSFALPAGPLGQAGTTWVRHGPAGNDWSGFASSADGTKLVATDRGGNALQPGAIYTSSDSGITWTQHFLGDSWRCVASSADGTKLVAGKSNDKLYTSTDSGATWTRRAASQDFNQIVSSADGTKLFGSIGAENASLYTSSDSGATWKARGPKRGWTLIAGSADGTRLVAHEQEKIHTSSDSGVTWVERIQVPCLGIASSADGSKLVVTGGAVSLSTDFGVTWTTVEAPEALYEVTSSADGTRLAATGSNFPFKFYTSADSGATWNVAATQPIIKFATSADGSKYAGASFYQGSSPGEYSMDIATSAGSPQPYVLRVTAASGANTVVGFASAVVPGPGGEASQTVSFEVTNNNTALFTTQPAISPTGVLTFTPGTEVGTATVTVVAKDDGGTANGGSDTSAAQTFTINVLPISNDAALSGIALSSGTVSPAFSSATLSYQASVGSTTSSITVTPTVAQVNAVAEVKVNDGSFGSPATELPLNLGANTVAIRVTAQDGTTTQNYTVTVTRQPAETVKPTIVLTTPGVAAKLNEADVIVTGTAADNAGLAGVEVKLNNGEYVAATTTIATNGLSATYTFTIPSSSPRSGVNTVSVRSRDISSNVSNLIARNFTYTVIRPLTVSLAGPDGASNFATLTSPFPGTDTTTRKVGTTYTITATAKPGFLFNGWTMTDVLGTNITEATRQLPKLTFIMQPGLELTANFIANPYTASVAGSYAGLVTASASEASTANTGFISATVTANSGALSASLKVNGQSYSIVGKLDNDGKARFGTKRATSLTLINADKSSYVIELALDLEGDAGPRLTGTLARNLVRTTLFTNSEIAMSRCPYSATNKVASEIASTGKQQAYTVRFPVPMPNGGDWLQQEFPQGEGYATMQITPAGTVTLSGKLADGTVLTFSTPLTQSNSIPFYASLYGGKGSISGRAAIDLTEEDTDVYSDGIKWFRPFQMVQWYPFGWEEGLTMEMIGAKFTSPTATSPLFADLGSPDEGLGNATLTLSGGQLLDDMLVFLNLTPSAKGVTATSVPDTDVRASVTFTGATGLVGGKFTHDDGTSTALQGVVLQKGSDKGAFGYFQTTAPKPVDYTGESGRMVIRANGDSSEAP